MYLPPLEIALYMPWTHNTHVIWDVDAEEKMASWQAFAKGIIYDGLMEHGRRYALTRH